MGMPALAVYVTAAQVLALPPALGRQEAVHGELLVTPAPGKPHQRIVWRLARLLEPYVVEWDLGEVFGLPVDLVFGPDSVVEPDVVVLKRGQERVELTALSAALLVIGVVSPSSARQDRFNKRRLYQEAGIPAYWIVDPQAQLVEIWTPEAVFPHVERGPLVWHPVGAGEPFTLGCAELFAEQAES
jgi:Uma2 family endonuclease